MQDLEKKKLQLTVESQLASQDVQDNEDSEGMKTNLKRLNQETNNVVEEINETLEEIRYFLADLREEQYLKWFFKEIPF